MVKKSENESDKEESEEEEFKENNNGNTKVIEGEDKEELVKDESDKVEEESDKNDEKKGLPVVTLFFDDNTQVRKSDYYNNIKKHLKTIIYQGLTSKIIQFDSLLINGALSIDLYQEKQELAVLILLEFDNIKLLKALNNNWVILDLVDYTTITWLANIKKDEWIELIQQITSNL
ncbi:36948_t:CDS:2 [Gigaspora margarita]|uniref:36948_t:CDS:1 n=1 Tax=Gigaspora margarita TaxID=4874 RepID=A0ABN7W1X3_GIGMA|nr:36948_t:CDS:2 [Gigaspora margarita]